MDLKYLKTIQAIQTAGSFQKAATLLNYAPSTVTFQVQQVEAQLGISLFAKVGRKMVLTSQGTAAMPLINQLVADAAALERFADHTNEPVGRLVVAVPETLLTYQMQGVLKQFKQQAPGVELVIRVLNCYDIYSQMVDGKADIAIHYDVRNYPTTIHTGMIKDYSLSLVAAPELADEDFITPDQDKDVCALMNDPHARYLELFDQYLTEKRIRLRPEMELWSIETIRNSTISGLGVTFLPTFCVQDALDSGQLVTIKTDMVAPKLTAIYAYRQLSVAGELFVRLLKKMNQ
ncbi:LysR family transcriptional regulator [Secundilactobacillus silagincola]|uniref:LysR family transcriptional regulator n=1 Tax=Secundilactobacillus silagincola TaxID=1714681 RepID=A0A1Z5J0R4_9LACO|nr:LysR family transcriptional regulator [Secundilactobacillus silagincola]GAX07644.1 LysR family transcriptional regulator [Secundilactobacillus silagincola]